MSLKNDTHFDQMELNVENDVNNAFKAGTLIIDQGTESGTNSVSRSCLIEILQITEMSLYRSRQFSKSSCKKL